MFLLVPGSRKDGNAPKSYLPTAIKQQKKKNGLLPGTGNGEITVRLDATVQTGGTCKAIDFFSYDNVLCGTVNKNKLNCAVLTLAGKA